MGRLRSFWIARRNKTFKRSGYWTNQLRHIFSTGNEMDFILQLPKPLVLASQSPRRAQLLKQIGLPFEVFPSSIDENSKIKIPEQLAMELAREKAHDVAVKIKNRIVIGADTLVVLGDTILGKPANKTEACKMLQTLSGKKHKVYTGFVLFDSDSRRTSSDYECTVVSFRQLKIEEIENYIERDNTLDKAGAYGIQDFSAVFVDRIEGCYYNVMGFPLTRFYLNLRKFISQIN